MYYITRSGGGVVNQVDRWTRAADGMSATPDRVIVPDISALQFHNGGRIRFGPDGHLYLAPATPGSPLEGGC